MNTGRLCKSTHAIAARITAAVIASVEASVAYHCSGPISRTATNTGAHTR